MMYPLMTTARTFPPTIFPPTDSVLLPETFAWQRECVEAWIGCESSHSDTDGSRRFTKIMPETWKLFFRHMRAMHGVNFASISKTSQTLG